jgi:hypothetical protein
MSMPLSDGRKFAFLNVQHVCQVHVRSCVHVNKYSSNRLKLLIAYQYYICCFWNNYRVHDQSAKNISSHVPVSATLNTNIESKTKPGKNTSKSIKKCNWKKADTEGFQKTPEDELYKLELTESGTVNDNLTSLMVLLLKDQWMDFPWFGGTGFVVR